MIKDGKGGANTKTGLKFEERIDLKTKIDALSYIDVIDDEIILRGKKIGVLCKKHKLYSKLLKSKGIDARTFLSKLLLPDEAIFNEMTNTLYIIEMKFQHGPGSVDEKLQTCDFKLKQYSKIAKRINAKVKYIYVLNSWFEKKEYKDVLDYVHSVGCEYYFSEIPLSKIGLD